MARKKEPACETEKYTFPSRLRGLMQDRGTRQKELADAIGMRPQTVSLYTQGQSFPDVNALEKIARFFSVSSDYLLGLTDTPYIDEDIQKAYMGWISVKDILPEKSGHYLVYIQGGDVYNIRLARYRAEKNKWGTAEAYSYFEGVTHWMPLPEPPKK